MAPSPVEELALMDLERSNKGASKQRRDQINGEISVMRDLLPLPESARQRLSQLQIMSLSCVFIRKCNVLQKMVKSSQNNSEVPCDFSQSLTGFLLLTTRDGKLLYISENVTEYLGHSMVDMKTQGDSLFDIVDKRDHGTVQAQLLHGGGKMSQDIPTSFFCRMNMSRTLKRQAGFGDVKVMHVKGHFVTVPTQDSDVEQQVFIAVCSPLITPDVKESLIQNNTMVFKSVHNLDMSFIELTVNGEYHLQTTNEEIQNKSWYSYIYPEDLQEAKDKHTQLIKSRHEMGCMMTVRMITAKDEVIWVNIVMQVRQALLSNSDEPVILCINQVVSEQEAFQFKLQGQLFALYASRTPDFFFGSTFCAPIPTNTEGSPMLPTAGNMFPSPFFSGQQIFDQPFATVPQPVHGQIPPTHKSFCVKNCSPNMADRQGRNDTLRALKRKIQENFTTCKPTKLPRMIHHQNGGYGMGNSSPSSVLPHETLICQSLPSSQNDYIAPAFDHGPMQMLYARRDIQQTLTQKKGPLLSDRVYKPIVKMEDKNNNEQVVPDVSMPSCYLTPDASPVSSPQPSNDGTSKDVHSFNPVLVAKYICSLKQKQMNDTNAERRSKNLPSLDVSFVDSFFDELGTFVMQNSLKDFDTIVKAEPIDIDDLIDAKETGNFDVEDILALSDPEPEINGGKSLNEIKVEINESTFSVPESHTSPLPLSPVSSITEDRMSYDEKSYCALTPESDFDSDHYEEIMDPENWMLQTLKLPCSGLLTDLDKYGNVPMVSVDASSGETELHQLRKFISSWTPSGVLSSNEDSQ